jgi:hypothetical protein
MGGFSVKPLMSYRGFAGLGQMSQDEYRANLTGINIFFGAVLSFVLSGAEKLNEKEFMLLLMMLTGIVVSTLYISSSRHRFIYALFAFGTAFFFPEMMAVILKKSGAIPDKIRPTLMVWAAATALVEFWWRDKTKHN